MCKLEEDIKKALIVFNPYRMVANQSKFHLILIGLRNDKDIVMEVNRIAVDAVESKINTTTRYDRFKTKCCKNAQTLCAKTNNKVSALSTVAKFLNNQ